VHKNSEGKQTISGILFVCKRMPNTNELTVSGDNNTHFPVHNSEGKLTLLGILFVYQIK
jgi:hypothetical protein